MKKLIYTFVIIASSFIFNAANAQVRICVWCGYNVSLQPLWGPVGYSNADYYYLPDIEVYYNVSDHQFIYQERGVWKMKASLPARYATFNLYRAYKVVINEEKPYLLHQYRKAEYVSFKGQHDQQAIRDSQESKYFEIAAHPQHNKWIAARETQQKNEDHPKVLALR